MSVEQILQQWDMGQPQTGWMAFRYRPLVGVARLLYPATMGGLALAAWFFLFGRFFIAHPWSEAIQLSFADQRSNLVFPFLLGAAVIEVFVVLRRLRELLSGGSNILLLTPAGIVKRFRGAVEHYPWELVRECHHRTITGRSVLPEVQIRFVDARNQQHVHLVQGRYFGNCNLIMQGIRSFTR